MTPYAWSKNYPVDIAMTQLEDCVVPCECLRCVSVHFRLQGIQCVTKSLISADLSGIMLFMTRAFYEVFLP